MDANGRMFSRSSTLDQRWVGGAILRESFVCVLGGSGVLGKWRFRHAKSAGESAKEDPHVRGGRGGGAGG